MNALPLPVDSYDLRARLFPGVIVTLPLFVGAFALWPALRKPSGLGLGVVIESALVFWLMRIARDRGKRRELLLFEKWGGRPTTTLLRWRNAEIDPITKLRYHQYLAKLIARPFPDAQTETQSPGDADAIYESAVRGLIEKRRGKIHRLVFEENCNYGFARNLLGLRTTGIVVYSLVAAGLLAVAVQAHGSLSELRWALLAVDLLCFVFLLSFVNEASVQRAAHAYAIALLRSCESAAVQGRKS